MTSVVRTLQTAGGRPVSIAATLEVFRRGAGDPTCRVAAGSWWLAWHTPAGPVTARLAAAPLATTVEIEAWGPGGSWFLDHAGHLLGEDDDATGFDATLHPQVADAARRFPGWRVPASGLVVAALVPAVIEQKVTGQEAFRGYAALVRRYGSPAPGPGAELGLVVPPDAATWRGIPSWDWLGAGIDGARSRTVVGALASPGRLEDCAHLEPAAARARLQTLRGIGVWTSAEVAHRALGDADAVSFGDYHVARNIGWALVGVELDDDGLAELLQPYAGHRYRVQRLLELAGYARPRRGPRMSPRTHLPTRRLNGPRGSR